MIHVFCAVAGAALCTLGVAGLILSESTTDVVHMGGSLTHDAFYALVGLFALMGTVERRVTARRLCMGIGITLGAVTVLAQTESMASILDFRSADLYTGSVIAVSSLVAGWRTKVSSRHRYRVYRNFDDRLTAERS